jgi:EAL domain-containing protein (putative c-di-GMP-specific phosphodiesterase class I)
MLTGRDDLAIVQSVIALARVFERAVIAEGVESMEIGARLLELGCDTAQGYAIARPMPAQAIPGWIRSWRPFPSWVQSGERGRTPDLSGVDDA